MTLRIRINITPEAAQLIARHEKRPGEVRRELQKAVGQGAEEVASHLQLKYLRGGNWKQRRDGQAPLAARSGGLLRSIGTRRAPATTSTHGVTFASDVGSIRGPATRYAAMHLGQGTTTIRPKSAKNLWIPVADNLNPSGQMRISPREAMSRRGKRGGRLLSIFKSRRGNIVAVLRDKVPGVKRKGGKLLFVLKKSVQVKGTDALALAVQDQAPRLRQIFQQAVMHGMKGGAT